MKTSKQTIKFVSPFPTLGERFVVGWMPVKELEKAWKRDHGYYLNKRWSGDRGGWFDFDDNEQPLLVLPYAHIQFCHPWGIGWLPKRPVLSFTNGRHRTRWMIQHQASAIPLLFDKEDLQFHEAVRIGLVEVVEGRDTIDLHCEPIINPYPPMRRVSW